MRMRESRAHSRGRDGPLSYFDRDLGAQAVKILPGEYLATSGDLVLLTLLGSCVAACLHDPVARVGGMNHFMLPEGSGVNLLGASARYGVYAMEVLLNRLLQQGASRARLQAKVFGGGNMLRGVARNHVGEQNVRFVREYLAREGIPIGAEDLNGARPRKVGFYAQQGRALVMRLPGFEVKEVGRLEVLYRGRLRATPIVDGAVELFGATTHA